MLVLKSYKGYTGVAEWQPEQGIYSGVVLHIRDQITFQSESATDLRREFIRSVDDYLAWCEETGRPPEIPNPIM